MRLCDLKNKEVINYCNCERLGYPCDIDFCPRTGCIEKLIVPGPCRFLGLLGHDREYVIPWNCIRQIGEEIILVDINSEDYLQKWTPK